MGAIVATELAWNGRRVDLATLSRSGVASAYELKIGSFHRVLEQAMYNRLAFDKSWVVVSGMPLSKNLEQAVENGIGVLYLSDRLRVLSAAATQAVSRTVRQRLRSKFAEATQ